MDVATGSLSTLLPKLANLLQDEYNLQRSARKGIEFLHKELKFMHATLRKLGNEPREQLEEQQMIWARDVRELSYDMEDIVDTFMVDVEGPDPPSKRGVKKIFKKMMRQVNKGMARREVAQEINDIKEHAKELAERRERYKVDIAPTNKIHVDPRLSAMYADATKIIVGIEEAKEEVITMLTGGDGDQKKRIVSIAGFGGLGKTTLAKAVYDDIKKDFDCTAFVSVSRNVDTQKLLQDMLYQLDKKTFGDIHSKKLGEMLLIYEATEFLNNKRYLVVIDDIWNKEPWNNVIKLALIENNMRSRIITTTRNIDVAKHAGSCYRLKPLSDESGEKLFYGRIFGSEDKCPNRFSEVSKKILKKCGGIPLAIVTTSSMLANKLDNINEWNKVLDSIGSGLGGSSSSMDDMRKILLLSYYDLPSHLKPCLLYLSIFPEDYEIKKERLIWRWVAEGFVQQAVGVQSFLEIGESYFNELLNRSMIQPADMDDLEGTPNACRVHDTVLDLIISLSVEECFITTEFNDRKHSLENKQVRRLSLHNTTTWPTLKMRKLRSLTIFTPDNVVIDPTPSLSRNILLRVLDLQGCNLKNLASLGFLGSLSHLRYLGLSTSTDFDDDPDQLPAEIGKLRFLQTLDLFGVSYLEELPSSITCLGQLMCLRSRRSGIVLPDGLKNLTSLEVLDKLVVTSECIARQLGHLTQLRVLKVVVLPFQDGVVTKIDNVMLELESSLSKLTKIESLQIDGFSIDSSMEEPLRNLRRLGMRVDFLPTWITPALLPGLCYLDIFVRIARGEDIQVLSTLLCLHHLEFSTDEVSVQESCVVVGPDAFQCAVKCDFYSARGLVLPCMFPRGAMPRLQDFRFSLELKQFLSGGKFTADDLCLGHLPSLRSVTVGGLDLSLDARKKIMKERYRRKKNTYEDRDDDLSKKEDIDEEMVIRTLKKKVEHEAAIHPNGPLRIAYNFWD
ncbi:unnamed protein product [Urochloa decumbens]|uniref:Uncharacterized protein n=1 Tax=Urochloa decumbens TaxID=240449 RepID=A0ABC8VVP5_9POAL